MIDTIITRLRTMAPSFGNRVEGAVALSALLEQDVLPAASPCAFVVLLGTDGSGLDSGTAIHRQILTHTIGVMWVVQYAGSGMGGDAAGEIESLNAEILQALAGFVPVAGQGSLRFRRSRLTDNAPGLFIYQTDFSFDQQLRVSP